MFGVEVCFYIFLIVLHLTSSWTYAKHVWENNVHFFRKSILCLMAIRNARLAENWPQVTANGTQFDSGSFSLK